MNKRYYFLLAALALLPAFALAQGTGQSTDFVPLLPALPGISTLSSADKLAPFLSQIYKICIGLAAVLAVLQLMRAGVMYMGGDSITEKKEARELITLSIVGLILVLTPVIVFNIINPKILNLNIDASGLKTAPPSTSPSSAPGTPAAAAPTAQTDSTCSTFNTITAIPAGRSCNTAAGYTAIHPVCCSGLSAGGQCCAKPNGAAAPASAIYGWRASLTRPDGSGRATQQQSPFTSSQLCGASFIKFMQDNNLVTDGTMQCNCNVPLNQQPGCNL